MKIEETFFQALAFVLDHQVDVYALIYPDLAQYSFLCENNQTNYSFKIRHSTDLSAEEWDKLTSYVNKMPKLNYNPELALNLTWFLLETKLFFRLSIKEGYLKVVVENEQEITITENNIKLHGYQTNDLEEIEKILVQTYV